MITINDVTIALQPIIGISPMGDGASVITLENGFVYVDFFVSLFGSAESMAAAELHAVDSANNYGYSIHIEHWQEKGYID